RVDRLAVAADDVRGPPQRRRRGRASRVDAASPLVHAPRAAADLARSVRRQAFSRGDAPREIPERPLPPVHPASRAHPHGGRLMSVWLTDRDLAKTAPAERAAAPSPIPT